MVSLSIPLLVAAGSAAGGLLTAWISVYAWRRRDVEAATPFAALAAAASVWSFSYAGALIVETETAALTLLIAGTVVGA